MTVNTTKKGHGENTSSTTPFSSDAPNNTPVVSLRGITTRFGSNVVHENLDLDVHKGEIIGLIGGSGTGKSVLLRTILGLNKQAEGTVEVMGVDMDEAPHAEKERIRRQWGVLFQDGALFSSMTVGENIQFPLREFTDLKGPILEDIARMKIRLVGLSPHSYDLIPGELSGGMRKRAGLARAIAMDPAILLLDEPTAGLDPLGAAAFDELILTLRSAMGLTVVMVTHDLDSLYTICDRVAVLAERKIYAVDTIENLVTIDYPWIQEYFGGPRGRIVACSQEKKKEQDEHAPAQPAAKEQ